MLYATLRRVLWKLLRDRYTRVYHTQHYKNIERILTSTNVDCVKSNIQLLKILGDNSVARHRAQSETTYKRFKDTQRILEKINF